ncbi:MAG TPA: FxsA family protein [Propylenella sp.]|nr:FxsA family protein [Propylenella sp.]
MRFPISLVILLLLLGEIAVFILVGEAIGVGATLALVMLSMIAGVLLLRRQGVATLTRIRSESAAGRVPAKPLIEGAVLAVAAILMIIPGFITDLASLLLFIPAVRNAMWQRIRRRVEVSVARYAASRPAATPVLELDHSEYGAAPRADSPWRRDGG